MAKEKTISDFIAKDNKTLPFEERAKKFLERMQPIGEELGVVPWAGLEITQNAVVAVPNLKDIWVSTKE